jgi:hypothetical protein
MELSANRVDFVSRLFARHRPGGLGPDSTAAALFEAFGTISPSEDLARANLAAILDRLEGTRGFPLSPEDREGIAGIYRSLYLGGPHLRGNFGRASWIPSYAELMAKTDLTGRNHNFMASEASFLTLKTYQEKNLIVPVVGDFGGVRALRAVGGYLKEHNAVVSTFYASNVEEYLFKSNTWSRFVGNVTELPTDEASIFIRSYYTFNETGLQTLLDPIRGMLSAFTSGQLRSYSDVVARSRLPR